MSAAQICDIFKNEKTCLRQIKIHDLFSYVPTETKACNIFLQQPQLSRKDFYDGRASVTQCLE